jgi:hypothetical protein
MLSQIPKTIYFYWGARRLSFLRLLSILSFKKLNPEWNIVVYTPHSLNSQTTWGNKQYENNNDIIDYTPQLHSCGVDIRIFNCESIGISNSINEVHKSDIIRYYLLHTYGGVWSDMDILYIRPIEEMLCNKIEYDNCIDTFFYYGQDSAADEILGHAVGFLMSSKDNVLYRDIYRDALSKIGNNDYEVLGAGLLNSKYNLGLINKKYGRAHSFHKETVYAIDHNHKEYLYDIDGTMYLGKYSIGIHWYGGSEYVKHLICNINHNNYLSYNNHGTLIKMVREIFPTWEYI